MDDKLLNEYSGYNNGEAIIGSTSLGRYKRPIAIVDVKPAGQTKVPLGVFTNEHPPRGFVAVFASEASADSVNSEVLTLPTGKSSRNEFTLLLANFGTKKETVAIFEI